jgi:hypothetical protein
MGWSLVDLQYFKDLHHLNEWLIEIIKEMKREQQEINKTKNRL